MKRLAVTLEELADRANLERAAWRAMQGKRHRRAEQAWLADADRHLDALAASIRDGSAPQGRMTRFTIHDPKRRVIAAACLADRVLHHAILQRTEPRFEQALSDAAYACRPGRGVHAAVAAVQRGLQRNAWVVHVDVDAYFANIDHAVLLARLERLFKGRDFLALLGRIVAAGVDSGGDADGDDADSEVAVAIPSQASTSTGTQAKTDAVAGPGPAHRSPGTSGRGLPIGSLTSQHFANLVLDSADRLLAARADVRQPVRYMDDMVWFCPTREAARASLAALREHLRNDLRLELKDRVVLRPAARGLRFCGYVVYPGLLLPGPRKRRRYEQSVARLKTAEARGDDELTLQRAHDAQGSALLPAQSLYWRQRLWWGRPDPRCGSL